MTLEGMALQRRQREMLPKKSNTYLRERRAQRSPSAQLRYSKAQEEILKTATEEKGPVQISSCPGTRNTIDSNNVSIFIHRS